MALLVTPVLVAMFPAEDQAGCILAELEGHRNEVTCGIVDAVTLCKDLAGVLRVTNAWHRDGRGLFVGGILATFLGGLAGPQMATKPDGRVLGALRGRLRSAPLKFELLTIGEQLPLRSSLMVVVAEPGTGDRLTSRLRAAAGTVLTYDLRPPVVDQFEHGGNVAFLFPKDGEQSVGVRPAAAGGGEGHGRGPLRVEDAIVVSAVTLSDEVLLPTVGRSLRGAGTPACSTGL